MSSTEITLVKRFHQLASDYNNRPVVVQRGTVRSIMRFMGHDSCDVRSTAAETILLLAQHPDNKEPLCREQGLIAALYAEYRATEGSDPHLHAIYASIFDELREVLELEDDGAAGDGDENDGPRNDAQSIRTVANRPTRVRRGATVKRSLLLAVGNLSPATHSELNALLQTIRGVVSYSIDSAASTVRINCSVATQALLTVLEDGHFTVEVLADEDFVGADDDDDENALGSAQGAQKQQPSYRRGGAGSKLNIFGNVDWRHTIVLHGVEGNSLQARLQRQKEAREQKHEASRSAMSSLLGKLKSWW